VKKIKWITQYDVIDSNEARICGLSSKNKMDYICSALIKNGWNIEIISPAITSHEKGYYRKKNKIINTRIQLNLFATFGATSKIGKALSKIYAVIQLFNFLVFNLKKGETIILSHSLISATPVYFAKKIKKFNLILDFGEEYCKVKKGNIIYQWVEPKLIKCADKFIFGNDLMGNLYGINPKNYTVVYGQYLNDSIISEKKKNRKDNKIHLVYAGIICESEKSAFRAIELANYLDDNYVLHILGKIEQESEKKFYTCIEKINNCSGCKVIFEGVKMGDEYINQMLQYDIGLNLRAVDEKYIDFAFPSKILSYLNVGLRVVSSRIKCVEASEVSSLLYYFDDNNPSCIAKTIRNIDINEPYNPLIKLDKMDKSLRDNIDSLILGNKM
jgi:hypothetical protein